jgi:hypothetical protein
MCLQSVFNFSPKSFLPLDIKTRGSLQRWAALLLSVYLHEINEVIRALAHFGYGVGNGPSSKHRKISVLVVLVIKLLHILSRQIEAPSTQQCSQCWSVRLVHNHPLENLSTFHMQRNLYQIIYNIFPNTMPKGNQVYSGDERLNIIF